MRIPCEVVFIKMTAGPRPQQKASKSQKAIVVLEKLRSSPAKYQITFALVGDKTGNKFELSNPPLIVAPLLNQGKATLNFPSKPPVSVLVSKAAPDDLAQLLQYIQKIGRGEDVDVGRTKIKSSDFKPSSITVKSQCEYSKQMKTVSEFLKTLKIEPINLRMPDSQWGKCRALTRLTLNGNPVGSRCRNLEILTSLPHLEALELNNCSLGSIPRRQMATMFATFPISVRTVDVGNNQLEWFPPLYQLRDLQSLNLSNNSIRFLPARIAYFRSLRTIDLSNNQLTSLPIVFQRLHSLQFAAISNNAGILRPLQDVRRNAEAFQVVSKLDGLSFSEGHVDFLSTIAANAVHRFIELHGSTKELPLSVRFQMDDLIGEEPRVTNLEYCTNCRFLRLIRVVNSITVISSTLFSSVDLIETPLIVHERLCMDCAQPRYTVHKLASKPDNYFQHSI